MFPRVKIGKFKYINKSLVKMDREHRQKRKYNCILNYVGRKTFHPLIRVEIKANKIYSANKINKF